MIVNEIVFLISFTDSLFLVYSNRFLFINFVLCNFTKFTDDFSSFLMISLGFSMYSIVSSANSDSFTSFPTWISFISFSCLIAVVRTSNTRLNKSGECGHPCFVPDLKGNTSSSHS